MEEKKVHCARYDMMNEDIIFEKSYNFQSTQNETSTDSEPINPQSHESNSSYHKQIQLHGDKMRCFLK